MEKLGERRMVVVRDNSDAGSIEIVLRADMRSRIDQEVCLELVIGNGNVLGLDN